MARDDRPDCHRDSVEDRSHTPASAFRDVKLANTGALRFGRIIAGIRCLGELNVHVYPQCSFGADACAFDWAGAEY